MDSRVFQGFHHLAQRLAGISLREGSEAMISARVAARVKQLALPSEDQYLTLLESKEGTDEAVHFLDAISTGFTSFWREPEHFAHLVEQVQRDLEAGQRRFRFWSAGCSAGHEPYSMAIALLPAFGALDVDWKILATDLSTQRLHHALEACYRADDVAPLDQVTRARSFVSAGSHPRLGPQYRVVPALRERVTFRRLNLVEVPWPMRGPFDAIFCRNVMFYFDAPAQQLLVREFERLLKPGGALYTGRSETLTQLETGLSTVQPSVYRKPGGADR